MRTVGSSSLAVETGAPVMLNHRGEPMVPSQRRVLKSQSLPPPSATLFDASGRGLERDGRRASRKRSARKFSALMEDDPELLAILYPIKKKQRSDHSSSASGSSVGGSVDADASPFDEHLRAIYDGQADDGLAFFESHGYYDVDEANTVEMFRKNFGLDSTGFWVDRFGRHRRNSDCSSLGSSSDLERDDFSLSTNSSECFNADMNPFVGSFVRSASMRVLSSRRQPYSSASASTRGRSASRFALLDDEGNEVDYDLDDDEQFEDEDDEIERLARELRLKARSLALDAEDVAELERDQRAMVRAVAVIRSEKSQLQRLLFEAFANGEAVTVTINGASPTIQFPTLRTMNATPPPPSIPQSVQPAPVDVESLPPYCGNVHVLRDSVPFLLGSGWRKRWFCLDFQEGVVTMFKRSYWKAPRGALDLRGVARIEKMGRADFRVEFLPHSSDCEPAVLMLRAKTADEADKWVQLLRFARRNVRLSSNSAASSERALVIAKQKTSGHNNNSHNHAKKGNQQVDMYARILEMANQQQLRPSLPSSAAAAHSSLTA